MMPASPKLTALSEAEYPSTVDLDSPLATRLAMDDVAMIPLYHPVSVWAVHPGLAFAPRADDYMLAADLRPRA